LCPQSTVVQGNAPPDGAAQWCERPGGVKHGPFKEWSTDGRLVAEGTYAEGKRDGLWRTYHDNGLPHAHGRYAMGDKVEAWHAWDADGVPISRITYARGGNDIEETWWWPSPVRWRGTNRHGQLHGRILEFDAQGQPVKDAEYDHGRLVRDNLAPAETVPGLIGVPECDDYIAFYRGCIEEKMPQAVKETSRRALDTSIDAWRKAAATTAGRESLSMACRTARDALKRSCE
jgi:hypothetical protein